VTASLKFEDSQGMLHSGTPTFPSSGGGSSSKNEVSDCCCDSGFFLAVGQPATWDLGVSVVVKRIRMYGTYGAPTYSGQSRGAKMQLEGAGCGEVYFVVP